MSRVKMLGGRSGLKSLAAVFGLSLAIAGCSGESPESDGYTDGNSIEGGSVDGTDSMDDGALTSDGTTVEGEAGELGTSRQALSYYYNAFTFPSSCSDSKGTNSVMAALAVAAATELKRWQPTKDFQSSNGALQLTSTGKAQCADGKCWNTQAILDLQRAPAGKVQVRPGVTLDSSALKSALTSNLLLQIFDMVSAFVPEHKLELVYSEPGGCDQYYWFNVTTPSGGKVSSLLTSTLSQKLKWVGGSNNPYIQFQTNGTLVGVDPTYGLNEAGSTASGSCAATCTKMSSKDVSGACCTCNGTKKFARSAWNTTTYICQ